MIRRIAIAALFLSVAWTTAPRLVALLREANSFRTMSYGMRRERLNGDAYRAARQLRGKREPLAMVMRQRGAIDVAVFLNYYVYPRPTRVYFGFERYRDAMFRGNAPREITLVDARHEPQVETAGYLEMRDRFIREAPVVSNPQATSAPLREFILPIAPSLDAALNDTYVIEGVVAGDARVKFTYWPRGETAVVQSPRVFHDVIYELFGRTDNGWLQVTSDAPVRASFWFVNHGRRSATPLPLMTSLPPSPQRIAGGEKLWLLNVSERDAIARVNGASVNVPARALIEVASVQANVVEGDVLAFTADRNAFHWPEGMR